MRLWARNILTIGLLLPMFVLLPDVVAVAGEIQSTTGQGVVTFKSVPNSEDQPVSRAAAKATGQGVVTYRAPLSSCPEGSERVGEKCVRSCPTEMYRYRGKCRCPDGLVREGNRCTEEEVVVTCKLPKILRDGVCVLPPCLGDTFRSGDRCICDSGMIRRGNKCQQPPQIVIFPAELHGGIKDATYPVVWLNARGGTTPYRYLILNGNLPPGINLSPAGQITGTPTQNGLFNFTVRATDTERFRGTRAYSMLIAQPPQIAISPVELPGGIQGVSYLTKQLQGSGGTAPYRFFLTAGALPRGLTMTPTGLVSGVPEESGLFNLIVTVRDAKQFGATRPYSIAVAGNEVPSDPDCPEGTVRFGANCVDTGGPPDETDEPTNLTRSLQKQLKRLGCLSGRADGVWGSGSRSALSKFVSRSGLRLNRRVPTEPALRATKSKPAGYCGPERCRSGYSRNDEGDCTKDRIEPEACGKNQYRNDNGRCVCEDGYKKRGSRCKRIKSCGKKQYRNDNGRCVCEDGYEKRGSRCKRKVKPCGKNQYRNDNGRCVCENGYEKRGNKCKRIRRCGKNQYRNDNGRCVCQNGYEKRGSKCKRIRRCGKNQYRNDEGQCACKEGYEPRGGRCKPYRQSEPEGETGGSGNNKRCEKRCNKCAVRAIGCMFKYNDENICEQQARRCLGNCSCN